MLTTMVTVRMMICARTAVMALSDITASPVSSLSSSIKTDETMPVRKEIRQTHLIPLSLYLSVCEIKYTAMGPRNTQGIATKSA